jgi:hypothetical protein
MEKLSVATARSIWFLDIADLNPQGKSVFPELLDWLRAKYKFAKYPASASDLDLETKGLVFKDGVFQVSEASSVWIELTIFQDGLVGNSSSSTSDSDAFLEDLLNSATHDLGLIYKRDMIRSKTYLSEVNVRLSYPLANVNPALAGLAEKITEAFGRSVKLPFELGGLSFWTDTSESAIKWAAFSIERKLNAPFLENRYFSRAPLPTARHFGLIEELERFLAPKG